MPVRCDTNLRLCVDERARDLTDIYQSLELVKFGVELDVAECGWRWYDSALGERQVRYYSVLSCVVMTWITNFILIS